MSGIGVIVSPDLEGTFLEILSDPVRDDEHQSYVMLLMQLLAAGEPLPTLAGALEETVRDGRWKEGVRRAALEVLTGYAAQGRLGFEALASMAGDIRAGKLDDHGDELLGSLLKALYPKVLSVAAVLGYLRAPELVEMSGGYSRFWTEHVPKESSRDQLADLLDGIVARFEHYRPFMVGQPGRYTRMKVLSLELLEQVLRRDRDSDVDIAADRLYDWLGVVSDPGLRLSEADRQVSVSSCGGTGTF